MRRFFTGRKAPTGDFKVDTYNAAATAYTSNALNQNSQISPPSLLSPVVPLHDEDGNQIDAMSHPEGSPVKAAVFVWDAEHRLVAVMCSTMAGLSPSRMPATARASPVALKPESTRTPGTIRRCQN